MKHKVLIRGKRQSESRMEGKVMMAPRDRERLKLEEGHGVKERGQPLETGKGMEMGSPTELLERMQPRGHT